MPQNDFSACMAEEGSVLSIVSCLPLSAVFFRIFSILLCLRFCCSAYRPGRIAYQQHMIGDDGILCHQCAGPDDTVSSDLCPIQHDCSHTDQCIVSDRTAMNHCSMTDGYIISDLYRKSFVHMYHTVILNIGVCPNTYLLSVCSDSGMVPDTAARSDLHIAQANGPFCDINIVRFLQFFPVLHFFPSFFIFLLTISIFYCIIYFGGSHKVMIQSPNRGVAQLGRALRSGRRSRRFKSCHPD